ncbi:MULTISPECIES: hypothetical protein [unclassified Moraxella]|nr:hypothetical protein [Moraxella sp. K1664]MBE9587790.1 hypothetical protein [Moraxella sp. K1630]MBE9590932.1 hypothetical protein [Moraxella sp. K127]MBE9596870.1 hypothetical protein [Moraxella sp. K2450]
MIDIVELDEIHSYVKFKKNDCWSWIAIDRDTKQILGDDRKYTQFTVC